MPLLLIRPTHRSLTLCKIERTMAHTSAAIVISLCFGALAFTSKFTEGGQIGVCYGTVGNDLPSPENVVSLLQSNNIGKVRLYNPNPSALEALKSTQIEITVGVANEDLQKIGSDSSEATSWVKNNVLKYSPANIKLISVGNEISSQKDNLPYLLPAMKAIQKAITAAGLQGQIKVSTTHASDVLSTSYPPSSGTFADDISDTMKSILQFLSDNGSPFMAHIYPYFAYIADKPSISLNYALFKPGTVVIDSNNGLKYDNLFDAMYDSFIAAIARLGFNGIPIIVAESGWPSSGGDSATVENAQTYINNLIKHVGSGTPAQKGSISTYIFSLFNENSKPGAETEKHFGLFNPDMSPSYSASLGS